MLYNVFYLVVIPLNYYLKATQEEKMHERNSATLAT